MKILEMIKTTKQDIKQVKNNTKKNSVSTKIENVDLEMLEKVPNIIEILKKKFINGIEFKDGFLQKSVKEIFKEPRYKKKLNNYLNSKLKNRNNSYEDFMNFYMYENLFEDLDYLEEIFDLILEGVEVLIKDLKTEKYMGKDLCNDMIFFIQRIAQLYNLYGFYLEDIGGIWQYSIDVTTFQCIIKILGESIFNVLNEEG